MNKNLTISEFLPTISLVRLEREREKGSGNEKGENKYKSHFR